MQNNILNFLEKKLSKGSFRIGQVVVHPNYTLHHIDQSPRETFLSVFTIPQEARKIALLDNKGHYRPLKTAANLQTGWMLQLLSIEELRLALDFLYPSALGMCRAWEEKNLSSTCWQATAKRQTGMYRSATHLSNEAVETLTHQFCKQKASCLRHILWQLAPDSQNPPTFSHFSISPSQNPLPEIPLLCREACNLFVAESVQGVAQMPVSQSAQP